MSTPAEDAALSTFIDAATSDADPGYPHGAAFILLSVHFDSAPKALK
jgi:hypothetical protein